MCRGSPQIRCVARRRRGSTRPSPSGPAPCPPRARLGYRDRPVAAVRCPVASRCRQARSRDRQRPARAPRATPRDPTSDAQRAGPAGSEGYRPLRPVPSGDQPMHTQQPRSRPLPAVRAHRGEALAQNPIQDRRPNEDPSSVGQHGASGDKAMETSTKSGRREDGDAGWSSSTPSGSILPDHNPRGPLEGSERVP